MLVLLDSEWLRIGWSYLLAKESCMRMPSRPCWIAIAFALLIGTPITTVWGQPAPDHALKSCIVVPLGSVPRMLIGHIVVS